MSVVITVTDEVLTPRKCMAIGKAGLFASRADRDGSWRIQVDVKTVRFIDFREVRESIWPWRKPMVELADRILARCPDGQYHELEGGKCTYCGFRESETFISEDDDDNPDVPAGG